MRPRGTPIGLQVAQAGKRVNRAFNDALAEAGGTVPVWLILNDLVWETPESQLGLARAVGIEGPTLTRHLDGLEEAGLVARRRDPHDRRTVRVEPTEAGKRLHAELLQAVIEFNQRLTAGLGEEELAQLGSLLDRLRINLDS
jgi:MarR family transcriptional regulator, transcriptional regulator for hemolysin